MDLNAKIFELDRDLPEYPEEFAQELEEHGRIYGYRFRPGHPRQAH